MTYVRKDLSIGRNAGKAAPKESEIIIVAAEDVLTYPSRDGKGVKLNGNFVLATGASMYKIQHSQSKFSAPFESEGDENAMVIKHTCEMQVPGSTLDIKEFVQNWLGVNCYVLHKACGDSFYEIVGTPCAPLQLMPTKQDNNDGRFYTFKFESYAKTDLVPGNYYGQIIVADPAAVADVGAVAVDGDSNYQYLLPALAVTDAIDIATIANLEHGDYISLIGSGGAAPATLASGAATAATVILITGSTWTALEDSVIQLQYFDAGATKYLIEVSRS